MQVLWKELSREDLMAGPPATLHIVHTLRIDGAMTFVWVVQSRDGWYVAPAGMPVEESFAREGKTIYATEQEAKAVALTQYLMGVCT